MVPLYLEILYNRCRQQLNYLKLAWCMVAITWSEPYNYNNCHVSLTLFTLL